MGNRKDGYWASDGDAQASQKDSVTRCVKETARANTPPEPSRKSARGRIKTHP